MALVCQDSISDRAWVSVRLRPTLELDQAGG